MPRVLIKEHFIKELIKFTKTNHSDNIKIDFENQIIIEETEEDGKGEIYLDISNYINSDTSFIKIEHLSVHTIGVKYKFFIAYKENNLQRDSDVLKSNNRFNIELFNAIYENKNKIPLLSSFCEYKKYDFQQVVFGETIIL